MPPAVTGAGCLHAAVLWAGLAGLAGGLADWLAGQHAAPRSGSAVPLAVLVSPSHSAGLFRPTLPSNAIMPAVGALGALVMPYNLYFHSAVVHSRWVRGWVRGWAAMMLLRQPAPHPAMLQCCKACATRLHARRHPHQCACTAAACPPTCHACFILLCSLPVLPCLCSPLLSSAAAGAPTRPPPAACAACCATCAWRHSWCCWAPSSSTSASSACLLRASTAQVRRRCRWIRGSVDCLGAATRPPPPSVLLLAFGLRDALDLSAARPHLHMSPRSADQEIGLQAAGDLLAERFGQQFKTFWAIGLLAAGQARLPPLCRMRCAQLALSAMLQCPVHWRGQPPCSLRLALVVMSPPPPPPPPACRFPPSH